MERCYDYLGCDKDNCVMRGLNDKPCWEVEGTLCNHLGIQIVRGGITVSKKEESCVLCGCLYYKAAKKASRWK